MVFIGEEMSTLNMLQEYLRSEVVKFLSLQVLYFHLNKDSKAVANGQICGPYKENIPVHLPLLHMVFPSLANHETIIVDEASPEEIKAVLNVVQNGYVI